MAGDRLSLLILVMLICSESFGQIKLLQVEADSSIGYYKDRYHIPYGVGGAMWDISNEDYLIFGYSVSDSPPIFWKRKIGWWSLYEEFLTFDITRKISRKHRNKIPKTRNYKIYRYHWSDNAVVDGQNVKLSLHFLLLIKVEMPQSQADMLILLNDFINQDHSKLLEGLELSEFFDFSLSIEKRLMRFCEINEIPIATKYYYNGKHIDL